MQVWTVAMNNLSEEKSTFYASSADLDVRTPSSKNSVAVVPSELHRYSRAITTVTNRRVRGSFLARAYTYCYARSSRAKHHLFVCAAYREKWRHFRCFQERPCSGRSHSKVGGRRIWRIVTRHGIEYRFSPDIVYRNAYERLDTRQPAVKRYL